MSISGGPDIRWAIWLRKKKVQVFVRTHLSHLLAVALAFLVFVREVWSGDLCAALASLSGIQWLLLLYLAGAVVALLRLGWTVYMKQHSARSVVFHIIVVGLAIYLAYGHGVSLLEAMADISPLLWLVTILTVGTFGTAVWELVGNKLSTSPQEILFSCGMHLLMERLENFCFDSDDNMNDKELYEGMIKEFLNITSETLCGPNKVNAGLMLDSGGRLKIEFETDDAHYSQIEFPLQNNDKKSAAGLAFQRKLVYVPYKHWQDAWSLKHKQEEDYEFPPAPEKAWLSAQNPRDEKFVSVLCVPVGTYERNKDWKPVGVLNYTTSSLDPFVPRDFLMSECFASVLCQALTFTKRMRSGAGALTEAQTKIGVLTGELATRTVKLKDVAEKLGETSKSMELEDLKNQIQLTVTEIYQNLGISAPGH